MTFCPACSTALTRYDGHGWGCDRCRVIVAVPPTSPRRSLGFTFLRATAIALAISGVALGIAFVAAQPETPKQRPTTPPRSKPAGWIEYRHEYGHVYLPVRPETLGSRATSYGPLGAYTINSEPLPPDLDAGTRDALLVRFGGQARIVNGLQARRISRRDAVGSATDVPIEELWIFDFAHDRVYELMTSKMSAADAEVYFATFVPTAGLTVGAIAKKRPVAVQSPPVVEKAPGVEKPPVAEHVPEDDVAILAGIAEIVLARHAPDRTRCGRDLARVRDRALEDKPAEAVYRAAWTLTYCSQACEDNVATSCAIVEDLVETPYLSVVCRLAPKHCNDMCLWPPNDKVKATVCAKIRNTR